MRRGWSCKDGWKANLEGHKKAPVTACSSHRRRPTRHGDDKPGLARSGRRAGSAINAHKVRCGCRAKVPVPLNRFCGFIVSRPSRTRTPGRQVLICTDFATFQAILPSSMCLIPIQANPYIDFERNSQVRRAGHVCSQLSYKGLCR